MDTKNQHFTIQKGNEGLLHFYTLAPGIRISFNERTYPCNNSKKSVSLGKNMGSTSYLVMTELVKSDGPVGDIEVSEKLVNGFKLAYNGSAKSATIKYIAIGGTLK